MEARKPTKLLIGGAGSGKTAAALAEYRRVLHAHPEAAGRSALWLAPTFAAAETIRNGLVAGPGDSFLDPGVLTFVEFAEEMVAAADLRVRSISSLQRRRLLRRLIDQASDDGNLEFFGPVAGSPGFLALVAEWIADRNRRAPPSAAPSRAAAADDPRDRDLALLHAQYQQRLDASALCDLEGRLWLASDVLRRSPPRPDDLQMVVADGFTDFTAAEHALLSALRTRARQTWITLEGEGAGGRTEALREELWSKTAATIAKLHAEAPCQMERLAPPVDRWPALAHCEQNLFRTYRDVEPPSAAAAESAGRIHIVAASGVQAEIEEIARRVKQLLVDGARPSDIVVAFRTTADVAERVRAAMDDFGVPAWIDSTRRLAAAPLVRNLTGVLRLAADDWPYRRVLQTAGNRTLGLLGDETDRAAVEHCVRAAQLPQGRAALAAQLAAWAASDDAHAEPTAALAAKAAAALARLGAALDALPRQANLAAWIAALERLARNLGLLTDDGTDADDLAAWNTLASGLYDIVQIDRWTDDEGPKTLPETLEALTTVAAFAPAPQSHDAVGRVVVLSAEAARFTRPRHMFVGGLSEQAFAPARSAELANTPPRVAQNRRRDAVADELLLFYQLVARAGESLTLSYPALDDKAQPLVPSPLLAELERCLAGAPISHAEQSLGYVDERRGAPLSRSDLRRDAVLAAQNERYELLASLTPRRHGTMSDGRLEGVGQAILDGIDIVASRADRDIFGPFEGLLLSDAARRKLAASFGPDHLWSPSQLELYAACPFHFFGQQVLNLEPAPDLTLADDLMRRGHLLHETLARLYAERTAAGAAPEDEDGSDEARRALVEHFHAVLTAAAQARPARGLAAAFREIDRRKIAAWAEQLAEQHAAYVAAWRHLDAPPQPAHFEARFGPASRRDESTFDATASTEKPFELVVPVAGHDERVSFIGQIDRIDVGRVGQQTVFNVIDYKTGARNVVDERKMAAGTQLQLPLYAMAAADLLLAHDNAAALSAGYWSIRGKGFGVGARSGGPLAINEVRDGALKPAAAWDQTRAAIMARIGELVAGIRSAWFPVYNEDKECTNLCELRTVCRIAHVRSLDKQWTPPDETP